MAALKHFSFQGKVWRYPGAGGWHFVYVDKEISKKLKSAKLKTIALGYIRVHAKIGKTEWSTTLFPLKEGPYLLAVKASVRRSERIEEGDLVQVRCTLL